MRPETHLGESALIVGHNLSPERIQTVCGAYFDSIEQMPPIVINHAGKPAFELSVFLGRALRASSETPSLLDPLSLRKR